jgi:hypothetical protein
MSRNAQLTSISLAFTLRCFMAFRQSVTYVVPYPVGSQVDGDNVLLASLMCDDISVIVLGLECLTAAYVTMSILNCTGVFT